MIQVAILGFGTVGSGVAEVLEENNVQISEKVGQPLRLKYILDVRDFPDSPFADRFVKDFSIIEQDPEVDVVVETIGGATIAYEYTKRALNAGKSVVTSNKELVATKGYELLHLAKEHEVNYLFEASVGGGIPIISPINSCLAGNQINEIVGILNGTTNYILTRMIKAGISFDDALAEAQANGYAERDPSADVEGHDACRKICILSSLAFGRHIYPQQVPTEGITRINLNDVTFAEKADYKIKLLGRAICREDGKVCAYVAPHLVSGENQLSNVEGVFNGITVIGNAIGEVMFYGRGAGKLPTASAVVADVIDAAKHQNRRLLLSWEEGGEDTVFSLDEVACRWYVRAENNLVPTGARKLSEPGAEKAVFLTSGKLTRPQLDEALQKAGVSPEFVMRVLD